MQKTRVTYQKLVVFLRRHRQLLTVFGALILFVTFVVKEGLRESVKDQLTGLNAAQAQSQEAKHYSDEMRVLEAGSTRPTKIAEGDTTSELYYFGLIKGLEDRSMNEDIESANILQEELRNDLPLAEEKRRATEAVRKLQNDATSAEYDFKLPGAESRPATRKQIDLFDDVSIEYLTALGAVGHYVSDAKEASDVERARRKERFEKFNEWSYALFSVGWAVALLGKLLEPKDEPLEGVNLINVPSVLLFARVYLAEKRVLSSVLTEGDPNLWQKAGIWWTCIYRPVQRCRSSSHPPSLA